MAALILNRELSTDRAAVDAVVRRAFDAHVSVADMVDAIRQSEQYEPELSLVARIRDEVVGFVMISHAELLEPTGARHDVLTLSPVAVHPDHAGHGIGSALVRRVLALAGERTDLPRLVTLEGSPVFYGRLGFEYAPDHGVTFDLPVWAPATAAQVFRLPGHDPSVRGQVTYPPAFALADS